MSAPKLLLKKRGMVEAVIDILKSICDIEHSKTPLCHPGHYLCAACVLIPWTENLLSLCEHPKLTLI